MIPLMMPMLLGGGLGLLTNRKDPLKGALLGAGMGAAGSALMPAAMGGAAAGEAGGGLLGNMGTAMQYGTVPGSQQTAMLAAQEGGLGAGGLLDAAKGFAKDAKPFADAAATGMQFADQGQQNQLPAPMPLNFQNSGGPQTLASLAGGMQQDPRLAQADEARRARRRGLLGGM